MKEDNSDMAILVSATTSTTVPIQTLVEMKQRLAPIDGTDSESPLQIAGLRLAQLARKLLSEDSNDLDEEDFEDQPIAILAGVDLIGAVGLIAARYLEEWGAWVQVMTTQPLDAANEDDEPSALVSPEAQQAMAALNELGVSTAWAEDGWELPPADLLIDAMQTQTSRDLIQLVNSHQAPALSVGSPSGNDPDSGERSPHTVTAAATVAFGYPLGALASAKSHSHCGELYLADIGLADEDYALFGINRSAIFDGEAIVVLEISETQ